MHTQLNVTRRGFLAGGGMAAVGAALASSAEGAWTPKEWTAVEKANVKTVADFLHAWETGSADTLAGLLADGAQARVGAHTGQPAANPEALRKTAAQFFSTSSVQFKVLETVAQGPLVVNTRIDRITSKTGVQDLHYLGVFFVKDGRIKEWSDYEVAPASPVKAGQPL